MDGAQDMEIGGEMQTKNGPCTVQRNRASRAKTQEEIIADYEKYSKYAAIALIAMLAAIFAMEVLGW